MMKIQKFTAYEDDTSVKRVEFLLADSPDPAKRTEWIEAHVGLHMPLEDSNLFLRRHALNVAKGQLELLISHYDHLMEKAAH
jgi:hypothetical protein